ncbi:MAG: PaaI family thioesterase [Bacteroidetes bacterium]|nr:PaaI family thioesterase [Bacteroidota bacterium]
MKLKILKKQENSSMCFVCGLDNQFGLKSFFYELENKEILGKFITKDYHQSYPGRLHGGIAASILDETIARAIMPYYANTVWGITLEFTIKYRKPLPIGEELNIIARIGQNSFRGFDGNAEILLKDGTIAVEAKGKYLKLPIEKIINEQNHLHWEVFPHKNDPEYFKKISKS